MKKYFREIDVLKGIAIGMVILGHSIIVFPINLNALYPWCNYLYGFICSAHMPFFFAISGFCFSFHDWKSYLIKKSKRLLIPIIVFGIISIFINMFFSDYINGRQSALESVLGLLTGSSTWFLYTLFIIFLIFPFIKKAFDFQKCAILFICFLGLLQFFSCWPTIFNIDRVIKYLFYFSIGYNLKIVSRDKPDGWKRFIRLVRMPAIWIISLIIWIGIMLIHYVYKNESFFVYTLRSIITSIVGMINILSFGLIVSKIKLSRLFEETGKVSLQLFLFNGYFLTFTRTLMVQFLHITSPVWIISTNVFMMYFVSYLFIKYIIQKVKLFRILTGIV